MIVGSFIDAGMPIDHLRDQIAKLELPDVSLDAESVTRAHLAGTKFIVRYPAEDKARHLSDIEEIISAADLSTRVKERAISIFRRLAEAEAKVHGTSVDEVHFHEVGAADAIVDVVGACIGLEYFDVESVYVSSMNVGGGTVKCDHGIMPVPAPATAELLRGVPTYSTGEVGELTTPTGAAILSTLASDFGFQPKMTVSAIGYGAGTKELDAPNLLRVCIGTAADADGRHTVDSVVETVAFRLGAEAGSVVVVETDIDDMNPEMLPDLTSRLIDSGALEAHYSPITMKHGRPGVSVTAICPEHALESVVNSMFRHSTTLGIRLQRSDRIKLRRRITKVQTQYGQIGVKEGFLGTNAITASPEYRDCAEAASRFGVPLSRVYDEALRSYRLQYEKESN
mgnify:CR=1 FL=1